MPFWWLLIHSRQMYEMKVTFPNCRCRRECSEGSEQSAFYQLESTSALQACSETTNVKINYKCPKSYYLWNAKAIVHFFVLFSMHSQTNEFDLVNQKINRQRNNFKPAKVRKEGIWLETPPASDLPMTTTRRKCKPRKYWRCLTLLRQSSHPSECWETFLLASAYEMANVNSHAIKLPRDG